MPAYRFAPDQDDPHTAPRWWSTMRSDNPGVYRHHQRWRARISVRGRWVCLGLYASEWEASRVARWAREGQLHKLPQRARRRLERALGLARAVR